MAVEFRGIPSMPTSSSKDTLANSASQSTNSNDAQTTKEPSLGAVDTVSITTKAEALHQLDEAVSEQSVIDISRVESLKIAIDTGQYDIDPFRVAEKFIQFESELAA